MNIILTVLSFCNHLFLNFMLNNSTTCDGLVLIPLKGKQEVTESVHINTKQIL